MTATFGGFNLSDGVNYYLIERNWDMPTVTETTFKLARFDGEKITGRAINGRKIATQITVLGVSRPDLQTKIDALYGALALSQQQLVLHDDGRYWIADAVTATAKLSVGKIISVTIPVMFFSQSPYAVATSASTLDTGTLTLTHQSGSTYAFPTQMITGGGNAFSNPQLRIYARNNVAWTSFSVSNTTDNVTITYSSGSLPVSSGDYIDIFSDPTTSNGFVNLLNSTSLIGFTGFFPAMEAGNNTWTVTINAGSVPHAEAIWTWTPRWQS